MDGWVAKQANKYYPQNSFGRPLSRRKCVLLSTGENRLNSKKPCSLGTRGTKESSTPQQEEDRKLLGPSPGSKCHAGLGTQHHTHAHTMPKGLSQAGTPCPVPEIFRIFAVWKRHGQEDECEEETNPPRHTPQNGTWGPARMGKGLTAATTPWEDPPGLVLRRLIQCNAHQSLGQHCMARY